VMRTKAENDTSAWLRSLVTKRGRNSELAEQTVRQAKAFTEKEALDNHLIDFIAPHEKQLLADLDGRAVKRFDASVETLHTREAEIVDYSASPRERLMEAIADPNTGYILLVLGALGIYFEFQAPGLILPGVAGGILALLGLSSLAVLPINWLGAALLMLALVLFLLEVKIASHGILGTGATVAMVLGAVLLINGPPELRIRLSTALAVGLPFALITMFLTALAIRARAAKSSMGEAAMLDLIAQARTALTPAGKVFVHGEYWDAISTVPVEPGVQVRVIGVDGMKLRVEPVSTASSPQQVMERGE